MEVDYDDTDNPTTEVKDEVISVSNIEPGDLFHEIIGCIEDILIGKLTWSTYIISIHLSFSENKKI